jgi:SAM-dependent methyltransferase
LNVAEEWKQVIGLYQRHASSWDGERNRDLIEKPWLDRFLHPLHTGASILDIGCGSGEPISGYLIERGFNVTGIDSSPAMIAMCQSRFPDQEWSVADMRTLSFDRRFDGILAWDSFFHLRPEEQRQMFPIFREHAAPQALLMFNSGSSLGCAIGCYHGEPLYHGSLDEEEYRSLLEENGFDVIEHVADDPDCGGRAVWLTLLR